MVQFEFNREDAEAQSNAKETRGVSPLAYHCVWRLSGQPGLSIQTVPLLKDKGDCLIPLIHLRFSFIEISRLRTSAGSK